MMRRSRVWVVIVGLLLGACAAPNQSAPSSSPDGDSDACGPSVDIEPAYLRLTRPMAWTTADGLTLRDKVGGESSEIRAEVIGGAPFGKADWWSTEVSITPALASALPAPALGSRFVFGIYPSSGSVLVAGVLRGDVVSFVDECSDSGLSDALGSYVRNAPASRTPVGTLQALAAHPTGSEAADFTAFFNPRDVAWTDLPPAERQIDEEETPQSVLGSLDHVGISYRLPPQWLDQGLVICSRLQMAWGECVELSTANDLSEMQSSASPGQGLEFWLFDQEVNLSSPLGRLLVVGPRSVQAAEAAHAKLVLIPTGQYQSARDLRSSLRSGRPALRLSDTG